MVDIKEFVAEGMARLYQSTVQLVKDLTQEELRWQPTPQANPIGFILFHLIRTEDVYFHRSIERVAEVWEREGWNSRIPTPVSGWSTNWTMDQVKAFQMPPVKALLDYWTAERESSIKVLYSLDPARFPMPVRPNRPEVTIASVLRSAVTHGAEHQGQIDYIVGLLKNKPTI